MLSLPAEARMETRWQFGRRSQREEWSRRVGARQPAVFRNPVVLVCGHTHGCTDRIGRLSGVTGTEVMWAAQPKILTVSGPCGKKFASSSLGEIRAGFRFHLPRGEEKERAECGPDSVTVASYSLSFFPVALCSPVPPLSCMQSHLGPSLAQVQDALPGQGTCKSVPGQLLTLVTTDLVV